MNGYCDRCGQALPTSGVCGCAAYFNPASECKICGLDVGKLSYGGPEVCPACDAGYTTVRLQQEVAALRATNKELLEALEWASERLDLADEGHFDEGGMVYLKAVLAKALGDK